MTGPTTWMSSPVPDAISTVTVQRVRAGVRARRAHRARGGEANPSRKPSWAVTVIGLVDFANAFVQARSAAVVADLGAAYYIPIVIVPAAVVAHVMTLGILLRRA